MNALTKKALLDRLGGCEVAPQLVGLVWHVHGDMDSAWHDMSVAVLRHYIPQLADISAPAGVADCDML